jgi:hypothetical protein
MPYDLVRELYLTPLCTNFHHGSVGTESVALTGPTARITTAIVRIRSQTRLGPAASSPSDTLYIGVIQELGLSPSV